MKVLLCILLALVTYFEVSNAGEFGFTVTTVPQKARVCELDWKNAPSDIKVLKGEGDLPKKKSRLLEKLKVGTGVTCKDEQEINTANSIECHSEKPKDHCKMTYGTYYSHGTTESIFKPKDCELLGTKVFTERDSIRGSIPNSWKIFDGASIQYTVTKKEDNKPTEAKLSFSNLPFHLSQCLDKTYGALGFKLFKPTDSDTTKGKFTCGCCNEADTEKNFDITVIFALKKQKTDKEFKVYKVTIQLGDKKYVSYYPKDKTLATLTHTYTMKGSTELTVDAGTEISSATVPTVENKKTATALSFAFNWGGAGSPPMILMKMAHDWKFVIDNTFSQQITVNIEYNEAGFISLKERISSLLVKHQSAHSLQP